jgi:DNA-binding Lrp family transcriptional regulator
MHANMGHAKESIFYVQGGARAWMTTKEDWGLRFPDTFVGMHLVAGNPDILLRFRGTSAQLGNVFLRLQRETVGPRLSINGRSVEPRPPLDVTPHVVDVLKDENSKLWDSGNPGDDIDGFVEVDVKRASPDEPSNVDPVAEILKSMGEVDFLARIHNRERLLAHVRSNNSQRFDEVLFCSIHMDERVKSTRTFFVLNRPALPDNIKVLRRQSPDSKEQLSSFILIGVGHRSAPDILETWKRPGSGVEASIVYSETDIIRRFPPGDDNASEPVFDLLTAGLGEDQRTPTSVRVLQVRPPVRDKPLPIGGVRAYVLIHVKGHGNSRNAALLGGLGEHDDLEHFEYLAEVVNQPLLVGRVRMENKDGMDEFVMRDLRARHPLILSTTTYITVEEGAKPSGKAATELVADVLEPHPNGLTQHEIDKLVSEFCTKNRVSVPDLNPVFKRAKKNEGRIGFRDGRFFLKQTVTNRQSKAGTK